MTQEVLERFAPIGVQVLKDAVSRVSSSGATADSIEAEVEPDHLIIYGRVGFQALETGRGPRKSSQYGQFDQHLEEWLQAQGFASKTSKTGIKYFNLGGQWFSAKSLAWKINKEGDKKWRQGHGAIVKDVYSKALAKFVESLEAAIILDKMTEASKQILEPLNVQ